MENFLKKAIQKHGDKYDYSKVEYKNSNSKVIIICKQHGEFLQSPNSHSNKGSGCRKCVIHKNNIRYTTETWIIKAKQIHNDRFDYSKVDYINSTTNVIIICKEHGEFSQMPNNHLMGSICAMCAKKCNYTTSQWIEMITRKRGDKYDYSKVEYINNHIKITIICKEHGEFTQTPNDHVNGYGCPRCGGTYNYTLQEWIDLAKNIQKKYGRDFDYSKVVYTNNRAKVIIICKKHGEFLQTAKCHIKGYGCSICATIIYTTDQWVKKAQEKHTDKDYDYSKVNYINHNERVTIICKQHGEFSQRPQYHLQGYGCPTCNCCPSCLLWKTGKKLCRYCKPKNENKLYFKTKEMKIVKFLKENIDHDFIHNKSVGKDCTNSHLYPDIRFDLIYVNLIVEIDEFKHRGANYTCDKQRMYDIIANLGTPCVFIRYNPDSKDSDKSVLLEIVKGYLNTDESSSIDFDDFGFKVQYLFY